MSNEITLNATLVYEDSESASIALQITDLLQSVTTKRFTYLKQNIGTVEEALNLGDVTALGWAIFINRDSTNYVELRVGTAGTKFAKIPAGGCALFYFGSGVTAPYAIANTAAVQMEFILCSQ